MLVLVTLLWGLSFPLMRDWQVRADACPGGSGVASCTLIVLRMTGALAVLAALRPGLLREPGRREHLAGVLVGIPFFLGFYLQVLGLVWTTPAMSAFITSLGSAWVPLLAWLFLLAPVSWVTWLGAALGIAGTGALGLSWDAGWHWGRGELLTLVSSLFFSAQILNLDRVGKAVNPAHLTAGFMGVTGLLALALGVATAASGPGIAAWLTWTGTILQDPRVLADLGLLTVFSTAVAFHWMNVYQPCVSASRAALIYLLEPLFASGFSIPLGEDRLTGRLLLGGGLILSANLLVELPRLGRTRRGASGDGNLLTPPAIAEPAPADKMAP